MQSVYKIYYAYQDNQMSKLLELEYQTLSEMFKDIEVVVKKCLKEINKGKTPQNYATTAQDLHYTTALYSQGEKSDPLFFNTLVFDLDAIDVARTDEYVRAFADLTGISPNSIGTISSGGGLHFWLELSTPIKCSDKNFYQQYKTLCSNLDKGLAALGLIHVSNDGNKKKKTNFDAHCFDRNKTLRLPGTINPKYDPPRPCSIVNFASSVVDFTQFCDKVSETLTKVCTDKGIVAVRPSLGEVDGFAVKQGCKFLQHYSTHQNEQTFESWHALGLIYLNLGSADKEADINDFYEASCDYPTFSEQDFQRKVQSIEASGHSSFGCEKINAIWGGCAQCPHFGKVKNPLQIQGENFISSEKDGFWIEYNTGTEKDPKIKSRPDYNGLLKKYQSKHKFLLNAGQCIYGVLDSEKGIWNLSYNSSLKEFRNDFNRYCQKTLKIPYTRGEILAEKNKFLDYVQSEVCNINFQEIEESRIIPNCLSFKNGVFNPMTGEYMGDHNKYVITYKLPYDYIQGTKIPDIWLKTVKEWFNGNQNLIDQLGYLFAHVLFDTDYKFHNFHFVFGDGRNGKGLAMDVLMALIGGASFIPIKALVDHKELRPLANNRLNISNEFNPDDLNQNVINRLKEYTGGGYFEHSEKYEVKRLSKSVSKFVIVSNDIFKVTSADRPVLARIRVLPFLNQFDDDKKDKDLKDKLVNPEVLTGIMSWVAEYGIKLFKMQEFPNPPECISYVEDFQDQSDPLVNFATSDYALCPKDMNGSKEKTRIEQSFLFNFAKIYFRESLGIKFFKWKNAPEFLREFSKVWFKKTGVLITTIKSSGYPMVQGFGFDVYGYIHGESSILLTPQEDRMIKKHLIKYQNYNYDNKFEFKNTGGFHERADRARSVDF